MKKIAVIRNDMKSKFGVPRQSGLAQEVESLIVFEPEYRVPEAFRGLDGYSHIWLIWGFSEAQRDSWSPTVRPPRLGGNKRMGVFATRSPFRPNAIGLSSVKLNEIILNGNDAPMLRVSGADLMDGTPIYDIKPYLPFTDSHADAVGGFASDFYDYALKVDFPEELLLKIPVNKRNAVISLLRQDPRPAYQNDAERVYGMTFGNLDIGFTVQGDILTVCRVTERVI